MNFKRAGLLIAIILGLIVFMLNRSDVTLQSQDQFELHSLSANGVQLQSIIHLNNPNLLSATIKRMHEDFSINGVLLGTLDNDIGQGIPGRKETGFPVTIRFTKDDYQRAVSAGASKTIDVKGEIIFQHVSGGGTIKVNLSQPIPTSAL